MDMEPPTGQANSTSSTNVTATIRDSVNHTVTYSFTVQYVPRSAQNLTTTTTLPSTTTTVSRSENKVSLLPSKFFLRFHHYLK